MTSPSSLRDSATVLPPTVLLLLCASLAISAEPAATQVSSTRLPAASSLAPGTRFRDCADCPQMVALPAGQFQMGSALSERSRRADEGPLHKVTLAYTFAASGAPVTRAQYADFVAGSGWPTAPACATFEAGSWRERADRSWRDPGFTQQDQEPVVCVSWDDAQAYVRWLSGKTGQSYRLLSEAEWEFAARAGTASAQYWGVAADLACAHANVHDLSSASAHSFSWPNFSCDDGYVSTSPVASFPANPFGLHDMLGNVWQWVEDCHGADYAGAPEDGSAVTGAGCQRRVFRGASWDDGPASVRAARRDADPATARGSSIGFRIARTL